MRLCRPREELFQRTLRDLGHAGWRLYYARWERRRTWRLGGNAWTVRAQIEVYSPDSGPRGSSSIDFVGTRSRIAEIRALVRDKRFSQLADQLESEGYHPLLGDLEQSPGLLFHFPATAKRIHAEREKLDGFMDERPASTRKVGAGKDFGAVIREFSAAEDWRPAGAGWSIPQTVKLKRGGTVALSILLIQRDDGTLVGGRELHAVGSVLVTPRGAASRAILERVAPAIVAAGYKGGIQRVYSTKTGRPAWLIGDFWKTRLGPGGVAAECSHLEELAAKLRAMK